MGLTPIHWEGLSLRAKTVGTDLFIFMYVSSHFRQLERELIYRLAALASGTTNFRDHPISGTE